MAVLLLVEEPFGLCSSLLLQLVLLVEELRGRWCSCVVNWGGSRGQQLDALEHGEERREERLDLNLQFPERDAVVVCGELVYVPSGNASDLLDQKERSDVGGNQTPILLRKRADQSVGLFAKQELGGIYGYVNAPRTTYW